MHPELLQLVRQRASEIQAAAHSAQLARQARKQRRIRRHDTEVAETFAGPLVPEYLDMPFEETEHGWARRAF